MRRPQKRFKNGAWRGVFYEGKREEWITLLDKRGRRLTNPDDERNAEAALTIAEQERERGALMRKSAYAGMVVREACARFFDSRGQAMARSTHVTYHSAFTHLSRVLGNMRVGEVRRGDIETFQSDLLARGLQPQTVVNYLAIVSSLFGWLAAQEIITRNPVAHARRVRVPEKQRAFLAWADADTLLQYIDHAAYRVAVALAHFAGLRKGEVLSLRWENVMFEDRVIRVVNTDRFTTKSGKERLTVIHPRLDAMLRDLPRPNSFVVHRQTAPKVERPVGRWALDRVFYAARAAAGLDHLRFHDLRGSFATELLQRHTPAVVQQVMGHEDTETTMAYYNRLTSASAADLIIRQLVP